MTDWGMEWVVLHLNGRMVFWELRLVKGYVFLRPYFFVRVPVRVVHRNVLFLLHTW